MSQSLHPRNRHQGRYDFESLLECAPALKKFIKTSPRGDATIDFTDADAVKALNQALLASFYKISKWDIPPGYLCPPIPGRADYLHNAADLLASNHEGMAPKGPDVRVLDIGVGANCIYPLIGHSEYGWSFVGSDIDPRAIASAEKIVRENQSLSSVVELRLQASPSQIFRGIIREGEKFDLSICNPPFHSSAEGAKLVNARKRKNLGIKSKDLNFGGHSNELWSEGGEAVFVRRMIEESKLFSRNVIWFSTLISKSSLLPRVYAQLEQLRAKEARTLEMAQGQKKSRLVAWTF